MRQKVGSVEAAGTVAPRSATRREAVLARIERDRAQMVAAARNLEQVTRSQLDVARRVSDAIGENPWAWLGGAFCAGLWLGLD